MRRFVLGIVVALSALTGFGVGTGAAATFYGYSAPGEWFSPGEAYGSVYDGFCGPWVNNTFSKGAGAWGLITFIDRAGNWNYTKQGPGVLRRDLNATDSSRWSKKLHCKNNSASTYQGGCFGFRETFQNCV